MAKEGFVENSTSRKPSEAKTISKPQVKSEMHKLQQESTSKSRRCLKCQGLGHFPNLKVVGLLVEEDEAREEDVEEVVESNHMQEDEEEHTMFDHETSLVAQRSLKVIVVVREENWLQSNVFFTRCTSKGKVCLMIIDNGSFENCISMEMVHKLDLKMVPYPKPYNNYLFQKGSDIKVKHRRLILFTIGKHYKDEI